MEQADYDRFKAAIEDEYLRDIAAAKSKRSNRIKALGIVREIPVKQNPSDLATLNVGVAGISQTPDAKSVAAESNGTAEGETTQVLRGALVGVIRDAAKLQVRPFTMHDIHHAVSTIFQRRHGAPAPEVKLASISSALQRLADDGMLLVIEKGGGKKATLYARKIDDKSSFRAIAPAPQGGAISQ